MSHYLVTIGKCFELLGSVLTIFNCCTATPQTGVSLTCVPPQCTVHLCSGVVAVGVVHGSSVVDGSEDTQQCLPILSSQFCPSQVLERFPGVFVHDAHMLVLHA